MKSKKGLVGGAIALVVALAGAAAVAFVIHKKGDEKEQEEEETEKTPEYTFYLGKDYSWTGSDNSIQITPYVSDEDTLKTCDALRSGGKGCVVAVRYGSNVYYRPEIVEMPLDWQGNSPAPYTDGSWVLNMQ